MEVAGRSAKKAHIAILVKSEDWLLTVYIGQWKCVEISMYHRYVATFQVYASKYPGFQIAFTVYGKFMDHILSFTCLS